MSTQPKKPTKYNSLFAKVANLLEQGKKQAYAQVNSILVQTYWQIGREIIEHDQKGEKRAKYGKELLKKLSADLTAQFGKGFSVDNLENMRKFYLQYPKSETLSRKFTNLSWSHYLKLIKIDDPAERRFYEIEAEKNSWSVRELNRQFDTSLYERLALSKDKSKIKQLAEKGQIIESTADLIKEPYILEFLGLDEKHEYSENDLETAIIDNLEKFLLELGKGFTFVARQKRITSGDKHFYIDLVFYNRLLKCFVLIDLKIGELKHQDIGQMQMYVNFYDRKIKEADEKPTIGIILCKQKDDFVVEYTLPENNEQIFPKNYRLFLPSKEELKKELQKEIKKFES